MGFAQYTQDYDEKFPLYAAGNQSAQGWSVLLQPYLKSTQIFQCPSDSDTDPTIPASPGYTDYAYNLYLGWDGNPRGLALSALTQTSLTVLNVDESQSGAGFGDHWSAGCATGNTNSGCAPALATFRGTQTTLHLDGQNYSFTDGHVKWYKAATTTQSAKVYNWWANATNTPASAGSPTFNTSP